MDKWNKRLALVFAVLALVFAVGGIVTAFAFRGSLPMLVYTSDGALNTAANLLQAVSDGDYDTAASMILGTPDMGADREADGQVGKLLWNAYQESLTFTPVGESFTTDSGLALRYSVKHLDVNAVTAAIRDHAEVLLEKRVAEAEDVSQVYDEDNNYRQELVNAVLYDAAKIALEKNATYVEASFTVNLVFRGGKWWALPDRELMSAITGGLVG